MRSEVKIICPVHGPFFQRAQSHLLGHGCPKCKYDNHIARINKIMEQLDLQIKESEEADSVEIAKNT